MGIRPARTVLSHAPDAAEDSKPTAELPLLLRPAAALQPRISAAERSRSLYFRCKKQQKQLVSCSDLFAMMQAPSFSSMPGIPPKPATFPRMRFVAMAGSKSGHDEGWLILASASV